MKSGIRKKILLVFLPTAMILVAASFLSYGVTRLYFERSESIFGPSTRLNQLIQTLGTVTKSLEGYLSTRHFESLNTYLQSSSELRQLVRNLNQGLSYDEGLLLLRDIATLMSRYVDTTDQAMNAKRSRDIPGYLAAFQESQRIGGFIEKFTDRYNRHLLDRSTRNTSALASWVQRLQIASVLAIIGIALADVLLLVWLTWRVTNPLVNLAEVVNRTSSGALEVVPPVPPGDDEVTVLARAYGDLLVRIRQYVLEVQEKAQLTQLLREAELHALQAQINPHFIFNTLNAGMQLAMFENAQRTASLMGNLSRLLRYNLRDLDVPVTLKDELETCRAYVHILKTRFADLLEYREDIDPETLTLKMPALILQPLLENAWMHGLSVKPEGGTITMTTRRETSYILVTVTDNGWGIHSEREQGPGQSTGIGLANVTSRLKLFFGEEDVVAIESQPGLGTKVTLKLGEGGLL